MYPTILCLPLLKDSPSLANCLTVGFFICLHQLLDRASLMGIMLGSCLSLEMFHSLVLAYLPHLGLSEDSGSLGLGVWSSAQCQESAYDMIVCISNLWNSTRELLQLINIFSKVAWYKITSKNLVALLYTKDKQTKKEIREESPFTIVTYNIQNFAVALTKQVLYNKNFKSLKTLRRYQIMERSLMITDQ